MSRKYIYYTDKALTQREIRGGWGLTPQSKNNAVNKLMAIINNPNTDDTYVIKAINSLININKQQLELDPETQTTDTQLNINIIHKE